jgi:hypothetical protein
LDPRFAGAADHDYTLLETSPCIDAGDPDPAHDDSDGTRNDIGAIAFYQVGYICGDANGDEQVNIGDAVFLINHIFNGGAGPDPIEAGDANCDQEGNVGDVVYLINYVFRSGPEPCCP